MGFWQEAWAECPLQPQSSLAEKPLLPQSGFDFSASVVGNLLITNLTSLHCLVKVSQEEKNSKKSPVYEFPDLLFGRLKCPQTFLILELH